MWPKESLTSLKLSRSTKNTAMGACSCAGLGQQSLGALEQQRSIGQPGESVVQSLMTELILEAAAF